MIEPTTELDAFLRAYDDWAASPELCAGPLFDGMLEARAALNEAMGEAESGPSLAVSPRLLPMGHEEPLVDDLGPCCICGGRMGVRNLIMLDVKAPIAGHGWGCVVCDLPCDGASAVLCDPCLGAFQDGTPLRFACRGYPADDGRAPMKELTERHEHDMTKHQDTADAVPPTCS
jgi:hypothetical protein